MDCILGDAKGGERGGWGGTGGGGGGALTVYFVKEKIWLLLKIDVESD